jgi:hypothetical protein
MRPGSPASSVVHTFESFCPVQHRHLRSLTRRGSHHSVEIRAGRENEILKIGAGGGDAPPEPQSIE